MADVALVGQPQATCRPPWDCFQAETLCQIPAEIAARDRNTRDKHSQTKALEGDTMKLMLRLWSDEAGFVISSELILIAAILVMGLLTGLATIRDQVVQEMGDVADAVSELQQDMEWAGTTGHTSTVAGTTFTDQNDFCEDVGGVSDQGAAAGSLPQCIVLTTSDEE
jgi:hypothetical protein